MSFAAILRGELSVIVIITALYRRTSLGATPASTSENRGREERKINHERFRGRGLPTKKHDSRVHNNLIMCGYTRQNTRHIIIGGGEEDNKTNGKPARRQKDRARPEGVLRGRTGWRGWPASVVDKCAAFVLPVSISRHPFHSLGRDRCFLPENFEVFSVLVTDSDKRKLSSDKLAPR